MNPLVTAFVRILEALFLAGLCGSAIVLVLTTVEDVAMLFEPDEDEVGGAETAGE